MDSSLKQRQDENAEYKEAGHLRSQWWKLCQSLQLVASHAGGMAKGWRVMLRYPLFKGEHPARRKKITAGNADVLWHSGARLWPRTAVPSIC